MNRRIKHTWDSRVYPCADCPYREPDIYFCGFCLRKILDELYQPNTGKQSQTATNEVPNETNNAHPVSDRQVFSGNSQDCIRWDGYYLDDILCFYCTHYCSCKHGCSLDTCMYMEEKLDAIIHGRIKRKPGSMRWYK